MNESIRNLMANATDKVETDTVGVLLFDDATIPLRFRMARVRTDTGEVYLANEFIGKSKLSRAIDNPNRPPGNIPVIVDSETLYIDMTWIEQALPEYASVWANIRMLVERALP